MLAHRDTLTQLPNRTLAKDRLEQLLLQARRDQRMVAALYLDLDNFKTVNDSLGHAVGDELLCLVAERLGSGLRDGDTVARLSGDEFLILLGNVHSEEAVAASARQVLQLLARPFPLQGLDVVVTTSLGIAVAPRDGSDVDELLKNADLAMYRAKDSGRNAFRFFDASMNENVVEHLHMASGLRTALAHGELQVHYQPQFDLHSGRIIGAEALVRWKHPTLGFVPPGKFIPVAERTGLINEVGTWVLHRACLDAQAWRQQGLGALTVAVNVSPLQFHRDNIEREVANALAACQLPADALELELTESLLVADAHHLSEVLQRLRAQGVQIAIDDFGTGYSNLAYLQRFAVHRLKIDQSFVRRMGSSTHDEGIVRAIIEMAHCLGLQVVAEGVEDAAMLHMAAGLWLRIRPGLPLVTRFAGRGVPHLCAQPRFGVVRGSFHFAPGVARPVVPDAEVSAARRAREKGGKRPRTLFSPTLLRRLKRSPAARSAPPGRRRRAVRFPAWRAGGPVTAGAGARGPRRRGGAPAAPPCAPSPRRYAGRPDRRVRPAGNPAPVPVG